VRKRIRLVVREATVMSGTLPCSRSCCQIPSYRGTTCLRSSNVDQEKGHVPVGLSVTRKVSLERPPVAAIGFIEGVNLYYRLSPARLPLPGAVVSPGTPRRLDCARKNLSGEPVGELLDCPASNRILGAGQHRGSTSAIRTALNALAAN
jgi:hypothetical protein